MTHGRKNNGIGLIAQAPRFLLTNTGCGSGQVKDLENTASLRAAVATVNPANIICGDSSLLIGRTGKSDQIILTRYKVFHLNGISDCIDIGNGGFHSVIDNNASLQTELKPCILCKCRIGCDTDCQCRHIRVEYTFSAQCDINTVFVSLDFFYSVTENNINALSSQLIMNKGCHFGIKRFHQLISVLNDRNVDSKCLEVFSKLQADKSAACKDCCARVIAFHVFLNFECILNRSECEHLISCGFAQLWYYGLCTGRQNKLIIALLKKLPALKIFYCYRFTVRIDGNDLMVNLSVNSKAPEKACRRLQSEVVGIIDHVSDKIRQAAVCV